MAAARAAAAAAGAAAIPAPPSRLISHLSHGFGDVFAALGSHRPQAIVPLADADVRSFIRDGFLRVSPTAALDADFHAELTATVDSLRRGPDTPSAPWRGNDCFPGIPELGAVLSDPAVHGALTGLLGRGYALHQHRHIHMSEPGHKDQGIHQDSYEDDQPTRHHRPRWCMVMFYPHAVTADLGPTAVVPSSHWYVAAAGNSFYLYIEGSPGGCNRLSRLLPAL